MYVHVRRSEIEEREQKRFVSTNRWPSEQVVDHYARTHQLHEDLGLGDGPRYYSHSLGKELYNAAGTEIYCIVYYNCTSYKKNKIVAS